MATHPEHPDWCEVRFRREAVEQFANAWPSAPPGDEIILWMKLEPCSRCGGDHHDEFGAIDPEYVTDEGLLVGPQICHACLVAETEDSDLD